MLQIANVCQAPRGPRSLDAPLSGMVARSVKDYGRGWLVHFTAGMIRGSKNARGGRGRSELTIDNGNATERLPIRVLFHISQFGKGGTETALIAWLRALDRSVFAPGLCVDYASEALELWRAHGLPTDIPIHVLAAQPWMNALRQRQLGRFGRMLERFLHRSVLRWIFAVRLRRLCRTHDVVCDFDLSMRALAGRFGLPWIGVSHFCFSERVGRKSARRIAKTERQLSRYAAVAVLTPAMAREALAVFTRGVVRCIELGNVICPEVLRMQAVQPAALPAQAFIISAARLDEGQKDHKTLLLAYAALLKEGHWTGRLLLLGEGPDRAALEDFAARLGISASVDFRGFQANPYPFIAHADALVLSSRYEGFGMVIGEAMALGTPVIASDCPTGPRDLLEGGEAGLLVPVGDVAALTQALSRMLGDAPLREKLIARAKEKIEAYGPSVANRSFLAHVRSVLG